jgi:U32 family peptidase
MRLLSTLHDPGRLEDILELSDGVVLGEDRFGTRLTTAFDPSLMAGMCKTAASLGKDVYIQANRMLEEQDLDDFSAFIRTFAPISSGIIIGDPGAFFIMSTLGFGHKAVYHPGTLLTNSMDFNMFATDGAIGAFVPAEITLDEIKAIASRKQYRLFMVGHGHVPLFYSRRMLVSNYLNETGLDPGLSGSRDLSIREEKRHEAMPIVQDSHGTHVFTAEVFRTLPYLDALRPMVDTMIIDSIFKDDAYACLVLKLYRESGDDTSEERIRHEYDETWDDGLLFKGTSDRRLP